VTNFPAGPLTAPVYAAEEVIKMHKLVFSALMATIVLLALARGAGASAIPPCCF
jgi:hypothetical protein